MKKEGNEMGVFLPDIKMYYNVTIITLDGTCARMVKTDQWNKRAQRKPKNIQECITR